MIRWLVLAGLYLPGIALAAPFCVAVQGLPDECVYVDGQQCQARALKLGGACKGNQSEFTAQSGPGRFCLVVAGQATLCIYPDRDTCNVEATRHKTACVEAFHSAQTAPDPFAIRRPY